MLATAVAIGIAAHVLGPIVERSVGRPIGRLAAPFYGSYELLITWRWLVPVVVAIGGVLALPRVTRQAPWWRAVASAVAVSLLWTLSLALVDGRSAITENMANEYDYLAAVPAVDQIGPAHYLERFSEDLRYQPTHVESHPPGLVLALWSLARVGLQDTGWALGLCLVGGATALAATAAAARRLAGDQPARHALPFLALAPSWLFATNLDLVYAGLAASGLALVARATTEPSPRARWPAALGAGTVLGLALLGSYGLLLWGIPVLAVIAFRRAWWSLAPIGLSTTAVVALPAVWGFWYPAGLAATRGEYWNGLAQYRPYGYFLLAGVAAYLTCLGPAGIVAVTRLVRSWRRWPGLAVLVGSVLAAVAVAALSGMSKGEAERIWQPFVPIVLLATAVLGPAVVARRRWLAANAGLALALVLVLRSPW